MSGQKRNSAGPTVAEYRDQIRENLITTSKSFFSHEPSHDKTKKVVCVRSEDSDQPGHPSSLIRFLAIHVIRPDIVVT